MSNFSKNVAKILKERGLTQKDLSGMTGIPRPTLSTYLNGSSEPAKERKQLIAEALEVMLDSLEADPVSERNNFKVHTFTIKQASKLMGVSEDWLREGLKAKRLPFGYAVLMPGGKWKYWLSPARFEEETGIEIKNIS